MGFRATHFSKLEHLSESEGGVITVMLTTTSPEPTSGCWPRWRYREAVELMKLRKSKP